MISVVIPTYKNPKCLDWCLKSAHEHAHGEDFEIIVVVDGFIEESQEVLDKYAKNISVLDLGQNYGMATALNYGVYNSSGDRIYIVNDDNVFPKGWDVVLNDLDLTNKVVTINQIERDHGIFNFHVKDFGDPYTFRLNDYSEYEPNIRTSDVSNTGGIFPFVIEKRWYMATNGFDPMYKSPFIVDWDAFLKWELCGLEFIRINSILMYHFGSISTKNRTDGEASRFKQSEIDAFETFKYKWGAYPVKHQTTNSHKFSGFIKGINWDDI